MIIMKFGGSSLASAERIRQVVDLIGEYKESRPIIVCSALGTTTNDLLEAGERALDGKASIKKIREFHDSMMQELGVTHEEVPALYKELENLLQGIALLKEMTSRTKDFLVSFGERLSVRIISAYSTKAGLESKPFDGWEAGIMTNSHFTRAEALPGSYSSIQAVFSSLSQSYSYTPFVTGYIAKDKAGNITTLGRGGSDLTASLLGAALEVEEIQVWKDVDGIMTTDPRLVASAKPVSKVSFEEASELAYFGAKVLHPRSILPAMAKNIPVKVKNSHNPAHEGTIILSTLDGTEDRIRAITCKRNVTLVDLTSTRMLGQHGFLAKVFQVFAEQGISVDLVATSEVSVSLSLDEGAELDDLQAALDQIAHVNILEKKAIVTIVGDVKNSSKLLENTFRTFAETDINVQMISHGASKVNVSFIVDDDEAEKAVTGLHETFFGVDQ